VKIPRCRATVSEEMSDRPLGESPGRPVAVVGRVCPYSRSQETGANRQHQPLSRVKGGVHAVVPVSHQCVCSRGGSFRR
jgi:hypothetical protein